MSPDPFRLLEAEHDEALAALARLEAAARGLELNPASERDRAAVRAVLEILRSAVREHNEKEERALFPLIAEDAPTAIFRDEHRDLRGLEQELASLISLPEPDARVPAVALRIVGLLREHIQRENAVLFPMARALLGPEGAKALARRLR